MLRIKWLVVFTFLSFLPSPSQVKAWDDIETHPALTERAIYIADDLKEALKGQLGFTGVDALLNSDGENNTITKWLRTGSRLEDDPLCRAANHFHNPWKPWEESELTDPTRTGGSHHA